MAEAPGSSKNLLTGNPRYRKLQDLNEGTFGIVMLALDTYTNEHVSLQASAPGQACTQASHAAQAVYSGFSTTHRNIDDVARELHAMGRCSAHAWDSVQCMRAGIFSGTPFTALMCVQVAIKFLERGSGIGRGVLREVLNHRLLVSHPNIVQVPHATPSECMQQHLSTAAAAVHAPSPSHTAS